jgi:hypothetical protein
MNNLNTPATQLNQLLDWLQSAAVDRFDLAVNRHGPTSAADRFIPGQTNLCRDGLIHSLGWLRQENTHGASIYFRPTREQEWPLVFLDDVKTNAALSISSKYSAAVVQTSPGLCHVWLKTARNLNMSERGQVQRWLAPLAKADPGSTSGDHFGRLPGFKNHKPARLGAWVNLLNSTTGMAFDPTPALLSSSLFPKGCVPDLNGTQTCVKGDRDESAAEYGWVMGELRRGVPADAILPRLVEHASPRRGADAHRYAAQTVKKARRALGL